MSLSKTLYIQFSIGSTQKELKHCLLGGKESKQTNKTFILISLMCTFNLRTNTCNGCAFFILDTGKQVL